MGYIKYGTIKDELPELYKCLANKENGTIHIGSAKKIDWICPNCGSLVSQKAVNKIVSRGVSCRICGDGVSKPEKITVSALKQNGVQFVFQKTFEWAGRKIYDFYLPDYEAIIEVNGSQHYGLGFEHLSGKTLEDQKKIDIDKKSLAFQNGIEFYFEIEAINTSAQHIVPQLDAYMCKLGMETNTDIKMCERDSLKSNVYIAATMWNNGRSSGEISNELCVSANTVVNYLKSAASAGLCDYTPLIAQQKSQALAIEKKKKSVRCVTTGVIFPSLAEACKEYGVSSASNIIRSCNGSICAGKHNGTPLRWEYV